VSKYSSDLHTAWGSLLTNEPGGHLALRFEQGDIGEGQVSREDVAEVCVQSLVVPQAQGKTFEVYNEPGDPPRNWVEMFRVLRADPEQQSVRGR
jgi:hypothetical protein